MTSDDLAMPARRSMGKDPTHVRSPSSPRQKQAKHAALPHRTPRQIRRNIPTAVWESKEICRTFADRWLLAIRGLASGDQLAWLLFSHATAECVIDVLVALFKQHGLPLVLKSVNDRCTLRQQHVDAVGFRRNMLR
jgi:hypothetical protein